MISVNEIKIVMPVKKLLRFPALLNLIALIATFTFTSATAFIDATDFVASPVGNSTARPPLILIPGMTGSRMENDPDGNGTYGEVWPNGDRLVFDPWDLTLLQLKLAPNGSDPYSPDLQYSTVRVGDIIRTEYFLDYYGSTINYFINQGYAEGQDFFVCPYDWRKDIQEIAYGTLPQTLDKCIDLALSKNPEVSRVNILAHSMGGLVARTYLAEPAKAQKVQHLVTLGSPFLGAPIILLAILDQLCFAEWIGLCFTNTEVLHELIQNYPAGYEIAPGVEYSQVYASGFYRRDRDGDGDGLRDGYLNAEAVYRLLSEHNPALSQKAQALYARVGAWANGGTNGVDVISIVGDQHASMGTLVEYEERPWYDPWGQATIAYRTEPVNGDGTVTLHSADLRDPARGIDLTGGAHVLYFNLDHGELPKDLNVLKLVTQIFASDAPLDIDALIQLPASSGAAQDVGPRTEPLPLNGAWLTVNGPVEVEIRDSAGNEIKSSAQTVNNTGATISQMGETFFLFLPQGDRYEVRLLGQQLSAVDVRIQYIAGDQIAQTLLFEDLPVTDKSQALLLLDTATTDLAEFSLDQDGDGVVEAVFPPAAVLNAEESLDTTPPVTSITVQGTVIPEGRYVGPVKITLAARDNPGGAGVAKIEYSLDGGKTVQPYSDPFEVDPVSVTIVLARAKDRAGNEEVVLASARLAPVRIFIPSLIR